MSRLSTSNAEAAAQAAVPLVIMARLDLASGPLTLHDGYAPLIFNGETYAAIGENGQFGGTSGIEEVSEFRPKSMRLTLSGVPQSNVDELSPGEYHGRDCDLYIALLDENGAFVDTPQRLWSGFMDYATVAVTDSSAAITLVCESRILDFKRPRASRYTNAEQLRLYPGDLAFQFVARLNGRVLQWGGSRVLSPPGGTSTTFRELDSISTLLL